MLGRLLCSYSLRQVSLSTTQTHTHTHTHTPLYLLMVILDGRFSNGNSFFRLEMLIISQHNITNQHQHSFNSISSSVVKLFFKMMVLSFLFLSFYSSAFEISTQRCDTKDKNNVTSQITSKLHLVSSDLSSLQTS